MASLWGPDPLVGAGCPGENTTSAAAVPQGRTFPPPRYCPGGLATSTHVGIISGDSSRDQITQAAEGGMVRMYCMYINFDISASD